MNKLSEKYKQKISEKYFFFYRVQNPDEEPRTRNFWWPLMVLSKFVVKTKLRSKVLYWRFGDSISKIYRSPKFLPNSEKNMFFSFKIWLFTSFHGNLQQKSETNLKNDFLEKSILVHPGAAPSEPLRHWRQQKQDYLWFS